MNKSSLTLSYRITRVLALLFLMLNIAIFFKVNSIPIYWEQREITFHHFLWSMNDIPNRFFDLHPVTSSPITSSYSSTDQRNELNPAQNLRNNPEAEAFILRSGIRPLDFKKLLLFKQVDFAFQPRHLSYLLEMLTFKLCQFLGIVSFRDYVLILLHILNVILLYFLVYQLTKNRFAAILGAILFLNSGIALATLLFPFRTAKIFVMLLFQAGWLIVETSPTSFYQASPVRRLWFFFVVTLTAFTDHYAFFLIPCLFILIGIRDGFGGLLRYPFVRNIRYLTIVIFGLLLTLFYLSIQLNGPEKVSLSTLHASELWKYLGNMAIFTDTFKAFFEYFVRRNFGDWDRSVWGILSFGAFIGMLLILLFLRRPSQKTASKIILAMLAMIMFKAFLAPHTFGVHKIFMPDKTIFPSLLFFSYYYPYYDALFLSLILALLSSRLNLSIYKFTLFLILTALISWSNMLHLQKGPQDALQFHEWSQAKAKIAQQTLAIRKYLTNASFLPLYFSFPSGDNAIYFRNMDFNVPETDFRLYDSFILTKYLRALEQGKGITSLKNIQGDQLSPIDNSELLKAKFFLDVPSGSIISLDALRRKADAVALLPKGINQMTRFFVPVRSGNSTKVVFFIKGRADCALNIQNQNFPCKQTYGYAYQLFEFDVSNINITTPEKNFLTITPMQKNQETFLIGPFIL